MSKFTKTYPTISAIKKLIKKNPRNIYYDATGRVYGEIVSDELKQQAKENGAGPGAKHFWVALMNHEKGLYKSEKPLDNPSDELLYPDVGVEIPLFSIVTKE